MKIKITAFVTVVLMMLNTAVLASFSDVPLNTKTGDAVEQLSKLGIINGYPDGTFRPDETLTRGQFAKIAVYMLGEEEQAMTRRENVVFSDVEREHWASGYINYIAEKEIINGYPDGKFGAEDKITYAQALTILVRLLGYTGEDVAYRWPDGYISKAASLGITEGLSFGTYENITRGNAAYVIYNTLLADKKAGSSVNILSSIKYEDVVIIGDSETDASIPHGNISTTRGTYKLADNSNVESSLYGRMGTLYLDSEQRVTAFVPERETVVDVTLSGAALSGDGKRVEVTYSVDGKVKTTSFDAKASLYYDGKSSTLANGVAEFEAGRGASIIYSESGILARIYLKENLIEGPYTITSGYSQIYSFFKVTNSNTMSVIRDGRNSKLEELDFYDVVYYNEGNNTLYAYTDKISGTYEDAFPLKSNVRSVKIAGREYTLSTQKAINKMNTSRGAFEIGDRVTLLLGRNGEVVDVVDLAASGNLDMVVLARYYTEISTDVENQGETVHYVSVVLGDGTQVTYEVKDDYSDYTGQVVKVDYKDETAKLTLVKTSQIYGELDVTARTLGGYGISNNCVILELLENNTGETEVKKLELRDIQSASLNRNQVIHAETSGSMKDITFLYVKDVTKESASFGVVTEADENMYTVLVDNKTTTLRTAIKLNRGSAVELKKTDNGTVAQSLINVGSGTEAEGYEQGRIRVNGTNYTVSDYVKVYGGKDATSFESMSLKEIVKNENVQIITLYSDRPISQGGIIRVIVVKTKK